MSLAHWRPRQARADWPLALLAIALALFGLVMVLSASAYLAGTTGDVYQFVSRQAVSLLIGAAMMLILASLDYHLWRRAAPALLILILLLLVAVFLSPPCRGVHRCLDLGPVTIQATELVKIGFLVYLAAWFTRLHDRIRDFKDGVVAFALLLLAVSGLIFLQPDMGTAVTLIAAAVILFFLAGARPLHLGLGIMVSAALLALLIFVAPYRLARLQTFLSPTADPLGAGYQTNQISIAIGSGGWWGLGFGQGKLKYLGYVPEVHTDSIFAVVVEELGFVRSLAVLAVFLGLIMRGLKIARGAPDRFGRLLAAALITLIGVQILINLAAMLRFVPLTGIPLPFISFGGSSLVATLAAVGILLSVSRARPAS